MATRLAPSFSAEISCRALSSGVPAVIMICVTWARVAMAARRKKPKKNLMPHLQTVGRFAIGIVAPRAAAGKGFVRLPKLPKLPKSPKLNGKTYHGGAEARRGQV